MEVEQLAKALYLAHTGRDWSVAHWATKRYHLNIAEKALNELRR